MDRNDLLKRITREILKRLSANMKARRFVEADKWSGQVTVSVIDVKPSDIPKITTELIWGIEKQGLKLSFPLAAAPSAHSVVLRDARSGLYLRGIMEYALHEYRYRFDVAG